MKKIILFSGIHGTGKDFILNEIKKYSDINIFSASDLIKRYSNSYSDIDKKVDNISLNQEYLIKSINAFINDDFFILNGHFCLFDNNYNIIKINKDIFKKLNLCKIILLTENIDIIQKRLKSRDNISLDYSILENFQNIEKEYSKEISEFLNVPLKIFKYLNSKNILDIIDFIKE